MIHIENFKDRVFRGLSSSRVVEAVLLAVFELAVFELVLFEVVVFELDVS